MREAINGSNRVTTIDDSGISKCRDPVANMETPSRERDREVSGWPEESGTGRWGRRQQRIEQKTHRVVSI